MATIHPTQTDSLSRFHRAENFAIQLGKGLLGTACTLVGIALTLTLFLLPIGVPLTLVGIALLMTASEDA